MLALLALIRTELQLLLRDMFGLIVLFIMPLLLVLMLTTLHLSQEEITTKLPMLLLNKDKGKTGREFVKELKKSGSFEITDISKDNAYTEKRAREDVLDGDYQILLIIPASLTDSINHYTRWLMQGDSKPNIKTIRTYLDPSVTQNFKDSIHAQLEEFNQNLQLEAMRSILKGMTRSNRFNKKQPAIKTQTTYASVKPTSKEPSSVQRYVPAWTLFGMFLIMIPIAGIYVKERDQGIIQRLYVAPVHKITYLFGRIITFVFLNMLQLTLMFAVGVFILPLIGLPALNVHNHILMLALVGFAISLAATGFGVLLGTWLRTFEQAMAIGPTLIIIAAAVSGIMLPLYLMPDQLRLLSEYSPMHWGHKAFLGILVREGGFTQVYPELIKLVVFFVITVLLSLIRYMRKR